MCSHTLTEKYIYIHRRHDSTQVFIWPEIIWVMGQIWPAGHQLMKFSMTWDSLCECCLLNRFIICLYEWNRSVRRRSSSEGAWTEDTESSLQGSVFFCQLTIVENEAVPDVRPFTFQLSCNVVFLVYSVWLDLLQTSSPLQWSWGVLWLLLGAMCPVFCLFGFFCFQGKTCFILGNIWSSAHCRRWVGTGTRIWLEALACCCLKIEQPLMALIDLDSRLAVETFSAEFIFVSRDGDQDPDQDRGHSS